VPPASPAGEPGAAAEPEPPAAPEPEPIASDEPEASAPAAPEPESSGADLGAGAAAAGAGAAPSGSADEPAEEPKPKRRRSSGSRKVPKEALAAAGGDDQPKVGDEVQLKVGGGRFDAGTKGTVVDVFSAGVIVELSDDEGRTERLDLPFEAIGPADK
jgi:sRNA-binding protein